MKQSEAPRGTVITVGHPGNEHMAAKGTDGWRYVDDGLPVHEDAFGGRWDIVSVPGEAAATLQAMRDYAEFADQKCEADASDYNVGRADTATEAINRVMAASSRSRSTTAQEG